MEEQQIAKEKVAAEVKRVSEAKVAAEEWWRVVAVTKVQAMEAEVHCIAKEKLAVARQRAILEEEAKCKAKAKAQEGVEVEQGGGLLRKQKGQAEGE